MQPAPTAQPAALALARRSALLLLVCALAAAAGVASSVGTDRARATAPSGQGVEFGFNQWTDPATYPLQRKLNAPIRRFLVGWNQVERSPGNWNWTMIDMRYHDLLAAGLRPLMVAGGPPCWAHPSNPCGDTDTGATPPDPQYEADWSDFIARLAARYPQTVAIEVWNEPNLPGHFLPHPDPVRYTQLLQEAYEAVKSVNPSMPVISGGLGPRPYGYEDAHFLSGMYAVGARGFMDGIGLHPYPIAGGGGQPLRWDPVALQQTLDRIRAVRDAAGDHAMPLWLTEFGESTIFGGGGGPGFPAAQSESQQATDLVAMVHAIKAASDIRVALIHNVVDAGSKPGFGVFRADSTPKPAACALSAEFGGTLPCDAPSPPGSGSAGVGGATGGGATGGGPTGAGTTIGCGAMDGGVTSSGGLVGVPGRGGRRHPAGGRWKGGGQRHKHRRHKHRRRRHGRVAQRAVLPGAGCGSG